MTVQRTCSYSCRSNYTQTKYKIIINKRLLWRIIFNRFTYPRVTIDVLADESVEEVMKIFVEVFDVNVWTVVVIDTFDGV